MRDAEKQAMIVRGGVGILLMVVGLFVLIGAFNIDVPVFWLSALVTLVGVFTVAAVPTVGMALMGIGVFMLLRDFGVINVPWVGYIFGAFLVFVGVYGIFGGAWQKNKDDRPRTTNSSE